MGRLTKKIVEKIEDAVFGKQERINAEIEKDLKDLDDKDKK